MEDIVKLTVMVAVFFAVGAVVKAITWLFSKDDHPSKGDRMNKKQRILLWCVAVVQVVMVLFPPYRHLSHSTSGGDYRFILHPSASAGNLDLYSFLIQWIAMITLAFVAYHLLRDK